MSQKTHSNPTTWFSLRLEGQSPGTSAAAPPPPIVPLAASALPLHTNEYDMRCMETWGGNAATRTTIRMAGLDAWVYSRPHDRAESGGDVYFASSCAAGHAARVLLADISGHGASASRIGRRLHRLMRRYVNSVDQTRFMGHLNRAFADARAPGRFATAVAATYWAPINRLTVSNAGHPRPLLYRAAYKRWYVINLDGDSTCSNTDALPPNLPLGVHRPVQYSECSLQLSAGDLVFMYTDALVETKLANDQSLNEEGLLLLLRSMQSAEPRTILGKLLDTLARESAEPISDDLTLLMLRPNDSWLRNSVGNVARAYGRIALSMLNPLRGLPGSPPDLKPPVL